MWTVLLPPDVNACLFEGTGDQYFELPGERKDYILNP